MRAPIGLRINTRRKALGISQAALARAAGISPSYLNLIEANKRQVGGTLLHRIAAELEIDIADLTGEAEHRLIHELVEAFADPVLSAAGLRMDDARTLVATRPDMAANMARLYRAYSNANQNAETYADRLRSDPLLSQLLHQVLSGITAIRSSAEILQDIADLSAEERQRFLGSITRETRGLTGVAQTLIGQFDQASAAGRTVSARREVDDMIFAADNYFPDLEISADRLRSQIDAYGPFNETTLTDLLAKEHAISIERSSQRGGARAFGYDTAEKTLWFRNTVPLSTRQFQIVRLLAQLTGQDVVRAAIKTPMLSSEQARDQAASYLLSYIAGAAILPYEAFLTDAERLRYDVDALSERYNASFEQVAHRLVTLRNIGQSGVPFGFLRAEPAGRLSKHFPLPGLLLPHTGHACPLWAIYTAFRTQGAVVRQIVRFADGSRYLFIAKAVARRSSGFNDAPLPRAILLATDILNADRTVYADGLNLRDTDADTLVGPTCRLCSRMDCASRQEAPFMPSTQAR